MRLFALAVALSLGATATARAQGVDGYASVMLDAFPHLSTTEVRSRLFAKYERDFGAHVHVTLAGFADGLVRRREPLATSGYALVQPQDVSVEGRWARADVRVGFSRVAWGRLDEFLPTDVVNPQDLTRFFLEGRAEGRLPVAMVRARWLPSDRFTLETIYVPYFRPGRFDQLDEDTAPFNIVPPLPVQRNEPVRTLGNGQGGMRASMTTGRVDWSVSAYRGFEPLPVYEGLRGRHPRFTMLGGDFETVKGQWGVRGEVAAFVDRTLQLDNVLTTVAGRAVEAGIGVDRKAGDYRVSGNVIVTDRIVPVAGIDRRDVSAVVSVDRSFARETRSLRAFAVYNPGDDSAFARVIASWSMRDNLSLEGSVGIFTGHGVDVLSRFAEHDFLYTRLKVFF